MQIHCAIPTRASGHRQLFLQGVYIVKLTASSASPFPVVATALAPNLFPEIDHLNARARRRWSEVLFDVRLADGPEHRFPAQQHAERRVLRPRGLVRLTTAKANRSGAEQTVTVGLERIGPFVTLARPKRCNVVFSIKLTAGKAAVFEQPKGDPEGRAIPGVLHSSDEMYRVAIPLHFHVIDVAER